MTPTQAITLEKGTVVTLTNDYTHEGDATTIPISYSHIARDLTRGSQVLMADGAVMMEVLETYPERGTVECLMLNSAKLGERKNCNLPGVVVDLPTLTEKDVEDLVQFGVKHQVRLFVFVVIWRSSRPCVKEGNGRVVVSTHRLSLFPAQRHERRTRDQQKVGGAAGGFHRGELRAQGIRRGSDSQRAGRGGPCDPHHRQGGEPRGAGELVCEA